jgi:agmatinase
MYTVLKIPFDKCIVEKERRGAALGPDRIEKEYNDFFEAPKANWVNVPISDDFEKLHKEISLIVEKEKPIVSLGGDHSISYGVMKGFSNMHKNSCLLFFDAHFDAQDDFSPPTHEDILKAAVKEGFFRPENIFVIGVRNYTEKELEFVKKNNIRFQLASDFSTEEITQFAKKYNNIYFNLDIDVIDPSFAPGTGWPEPLGLNPNAVLDVILHLKDKIKLLDIVEVSPPKDVNNNTSRLAAKFLVEFAKNRAGLSIV